MDMKNSLLDRISAFIADRLTAESSGYKPFTPSDPATLSDVLQPGDILLVEGNQKVSAAIKYLTQSTWSHAAMYVGDAMPEPEDGSERPRLVEVNLGEGCVAVPLSKYRSFNTRVCRAFDLQEDDRKAVVEYMVGKLGVGYDMRNIIDLARYLFPTPPVPLRWRRKMLAFGSGDPTRAICSTLIAQAYQSVSYPILPDVRQIESCVDGACQTYVRNEIFHIRHHSLFAPRDFDLSPYFNVVKPSIVRGFNYKTVQWAERKQTAKA